MKKRKTKKIKVLKCSYLNTITLQLNNKRFEKNILSYDVVTWSDIMLCFKINKLLMVYTV